MVDHGSFYMKIIKFGGIGIVVLIVFILISFRLFGLDPSDQRPGLWLSGEVNQELIEDWSFTNEFGEIYVQTNTRYGVPHSVTTYCTTYDGEFYLFSAYYQSGDFPDDRGWNRNVMRDSRVRLKLGDRLYDQELSYVSDMAVKASVVQSFIDKYPQWDSPGMENVYVFVVENPA